MGSFWRGLWRKRATIYLDHGCAWVHTLSFFFFFFSFSFLPFPPPQFRSSQWGISLLVWVQGHQTFEEGKRAIKWGSSRYGGVIAMLHKDTEIECSSLPRVFSSLSSSPSVESPKARKQDSDAHRRVCSMGGPGLTHAIRRSLRGQGRCTHGVGWHGSKASQ